MIRDAKPGHQLLRPPSEFCPCLPLWTTQATTQHGVNDFEAVDDADNPREAVIALLLSLHESALLDADAGEAERKPNETAVGRNNCLLPTVCNGC